MPLLASLLWQCNKNKQQLFLAMDILMIKRIIALLLLSSMAMNPSMAADLQTWPQGKPTQLAPGANEIQIINVWATWCAPCRKEMPMLSRWYQQQQGKQKYPVRMVGVALDQPQNIARFVQKTPVRYPIWRYSGHDSAAWMKSLGNNVGALPFTLVHAPGCGFRTTLLGEVSSDDLNKAVRQARLQCTQRR